MKHLFEQIREQLKISKADMARRLGITRSNYSMIIHGQHGISKRVALRAHQEFGIPFEKLLYPSVHIDRTSAQATTLDATGTECSRL